MVPRVGYTHQGDKCGTPVGTKAIGWKKACMLVKVERSGMDDNDEWMDVDPIIKTPSKMTKKKKAIKDRYHSKKVSGGKIKMGGGEEVRSSPY